ncbi:hypothetical protein J6590_023529 [Homalodisca vitripennis]|nr:hypothetical protein J6590_023529 [Homalodisca vitripennis]
MTKSLCAYRPGRLCVALLRSAYTMMRNKTMTPRPVYKNNVVINSQYIPLSSKAVRNWKTIAVGGAIPAVHPLRLRGVVVRVNCSLCPFTTHRASAVHNLNSVAGRPGGSAGVNVCELILVFFCAVKL